MQTDGSNASDGRAAAVANKTNDNGNQSNSLTTSNTSEHNATTTATHDHSVKLSDISPPSPITLAQEEKLSSPLAIININTNNNDQTKNNDTQLLSSFDNNNNPNKQPNISDLIGEFGLYQLSLALITLIRYVCVAMMTNSGPLLAPSLTFYCQLNTTANYSTTTTTTSAELMKLNVVQNGTTTATKYSSDLNYRILEDTCQVNFSNGSTYRCSQWSYNTTDSGITLTDSFNLVCDRDWLRSAFQSSVSVGVMIASVLFGSFSDEHGRRLTMLVTSVISLVAGLASWWAPNFLIYTLARSLCSMCDLGLVCSLYTTIVETMGNKYRGAVCLVVFTGWSLGVMIMPWITDHFRDYRLVMLFTVACHIATLPWLLTVGESIRWLLVNGRLHEAHDEIRRVCKWNSWAMTSSKNQLLEVDTKFNLLKVKYEQMAREREASLEASGRLDKYNSRRQMLKRTVCGGLSKVGQIFASRELTITTAMIIWTTFNSELLYMLFVMINSDVGDNVKLNYAIGGAVETIATLLSIAMVSGLTRRLSLCSTLGVISSSMLCLAFTHHVPSVSVWTLNFTKLAISTLSSLVYVVVTELFPTNLRQTGMGLAGTLGSLGAVIAPFIRTELVNMIGMTHVMLCLLLLPLSAALLIPFYLRETKDVELADHVDDIDSQQQQHTMINSNEAK